jgi:uncharacterized protein with NRDE domain
MQGDRQVLAPRDEQAGGTWLGLNDRGLFVGITNRAFAANDPERASRGLLVKEALGAATARELADRHAGLAGNQFNAFHLFYADRETAHVLWSDGHVLHQQQLGPGVHVITESSFGAGDDLRQGEIGKTLAGFASPHEPTSAELHGLLSRHDDNPFASLCVHAPEWNYGTRSSFVLRLGQAGAGSEAYAIEGPPCQRALFPLSPLVGELFSGEATPR